MPRSLAPAASSNEGLAEGNHALLTKQQGGIEHTEQLSCLSRKPFGAQTRTRFEERTGKSKPSGAGTCSFEETGRFHVLVNSTRDSCSTRNARL